MKKKIIVIGGGISGLATAYLIKQQAREKELEIQILILEKELRLGGKIWSIQTDGYLCEWGANGFLTNKPQTLNLCASLGLTSELLASNDNARKRFVYYNRKLHKLPHTPPEFLTNSLISIWGKLRIVCEAFISKRQSDQDESLADFARRRLGGEALQKLIWPLASGIFAGNPETMSLKACFPRIGQLEQEYGSLIQAMFKLKRQRKMESGQASAGPNGPGGVLTSFRDGIEVLINRLREQIGEENIKSKCQVETIQRLPNHLFHLICKDQDIDIFEADCVICATPAYVTTKLVNELNPKLAKELSKVEYSPLIVVCLGYAASEIKADLSGFGYLLARGEEIPILGTLWDSSIFIERAPAGKVLFRTMLGGAARPDLINLTDIEIQKIVESSLNTILGISAQPELVKIYRHQHAIPQYKIGHLEIVNTIEALTKETAGLFITGNAYRGIGINDCVAASYQICDQVIEYLNK